MTLKFGTDGIRGVANTELTPELSLALGRAAASVFGTDSPFVVGRDTRLSGPPLQAALSAGLASMGADVIDVGVLPTPAVAFVSADRQAFAAMISASHNPFSDNGIKFFMKGGKKLSDAVEEKLEAELHRFLASDVFEGRASGLDVGLMAIDHNAKEIYEDHLRQAIGDGALQGLKVVLDCANGAASQTAPEIFRALGATVFVLHDDPDGTNINANCGSTHPGDMQKAVVHNKAEFGFAFDGDADRVLAADHTGALVDGDALMGMLALEMKRRGTLKDDTLVLTVMSNLGLRLSMERHGVNVHETQVGDRYVLEALDAKGWSLGGEQSGHVIIPELATTGDGVLTGLKIALLTKTANRSLADLAADAMTKLPQILRNVRVANREGLEDAKEIWDEVATVDAELGHEGRVLLRPSGTEPLVRVMVEAPTQEIADQACNRLCDKVVAVLGAPEQNG